MDRLGLIPLVLGADNQVTDAGFAVFDAFFEAGGRAFDTAWVYEQGECERTLGRWIRARGVRDEVTVIDKIGHTPWDTPALITEHLHECLERLDVERIDLLLMHRDNPALTVAEYVDLLDGFVAEGLIGSYGASNWSAARVDEANVYARSVGRAGFVALSNQLSLARMVEVPWEGCLALSDDDLAWAEDRQMTVLPWSSQGRGFFTGGDDRWWRSEDNFERRRRAEKLAAERGVEPVNVALAWLLTLPFPVFPLVGPRTVGELQSTLRALDVELTQEEAAWLDLG